MNIPSTITRPFDSLKNVKPVFSDGFVNMRYKRNRAALQHGKRLGHAVEIWIADNSWTGARRAWRFSDQLISEIESQNNPNPKKAP